MDLLIKNARVVDGTGNPSYWGDIGITAGQMTHIDRKINSIGAKRIIDADGLTVTPGFFDTHSHDDISLLINPRCNEKILQGVTTDVIGNCGASLAPATEKYRDDLKSLLTVIGGDHLAEEFWKISSIKEYMAELEACRPGLNVLSMVGHTSIRVAIMGLDNRPPTEVELSEMKRHMAQAMRDGAFGLSTGLVYVPASYAQTEEIIELAKIVGQYQGLYATHMRSEGDGEIEAIEETLKIARIARVPVHISHYKIMGKTNWGRSRDTLEMLAEARVEGVDVTCDQYPYNAASTFLAAALPPAFQAGGPEIFAENLRIPATRKEVIDVIEKGDDSHWENMIKAAGFEGIVISTSKKHPEYLGKSIAEIAGTRGQPPYDVFFDLVADEKMDVTVILYFMDEQDIRRIMKSPLTMFGTDSIPGFGVRTVHPRNTGTFPRILGRYVREQGIISMEEAIRKMTSLPAQTFRVKGKGLLQEGFDADIVVFNPNTILDKSTYEDSMQQPEGISWVIINGEVAVENGEVTGDAPGKVLRHMTWSV
jgi:N-acyl-D-aspartate/D-glutamate deacylase